MRALALLCTLALLLAAAGARAATAIVDRDQLTLGESLELRIRVEGTGVRGDPDLAPLERDFEVLGSSRNARIALINGRSESYTEWVVTLLPKREGDLLIPAIRAGSESTEALTVRVTPDTTPGADASRDVVLEVIPDSREVRVQQQLLLTVRVLHAINLSRGAQLDEPEIANAVVRKIGEESYEKSIQGRGYGVFERRYAVFPQASGEIQIPQLGFRANLGGGSWFDQFGGSGRAVQLRSPAQRITVLPPEPGANPWLPARMLNLVETWDRSPQELRVGESATRTLTLSASGLTGAQLPPLETPSVPGIRFYPDQPEVSDEAGADGLSGTRIERSAVIPMQAGVMELPEQRLRWWDTVNARFEEAVVPARSITVLPAAGSLAGAVPPSVSSASSTGMQEAPQALLPQPMAPAAALVYLSVALGLLAAFACLQWWRLARRLNASTVAASHDVPGEQDEARLYAALRKACRASDAGLAESLLLEWARAACAPHRSPRTLSDLARLAHDTQFEQELNVLLASRHDAVARPWSGAELLVALERLRPALCAARATRAGAALPGLYARTDALRT